MTSEPSVADGVVCAFKHVWPESWGPRLDYILINAVRTLLDVPGATLLTLPRLLIDELFREQIVHRHRRPPVPRSAPRRITCRGFWQCRLDARVPHRSVR